MAKKNKPKGPTRVRIVKEDRSPPDPAAGPLYEGECILPPASRIERFFRRHYTAIRVTIEAYRRAFGTALDATNTDRDFQHRIALGRAELTLAATEVFYSKQGAAYQGLKVGQCVCSPGLGHKAPPAKKRGRNRMK